MVNTTKLRDIAKTKGIKLSFLCDQFGLHRSYINNIERGKATMSDDRIHKVALLLGTSYEYLTDQTDDPAMIESSETIETNMEFIKESAAELLLGIADLDKLERIAETSEEVALRREIAQLLIETDDMQTLKMIKAALLAAKKE